MLVTSTAGDAWIFPKGNIAKGMDTLKSAAKEAYEEAGVLGECRNDILGVIQIEKAVRSRRLFRIEEAIGVIRGERSRKVLETLRERLLDRSERSGNGN